MNDQVQPLIFRGKADWTFYLELTVSLAVTAWGIWSFVAHRNILMLLVGAACALVDAVGLAQLWRTRYVLEEEGMQLQSGIFPSVCVLQLYHRSGRGEGGQGDRLCAAGYGPASALCDLRRRG